MATAYIGIGSNLNDTKANIATAIEKIRRDVGKILRASDCYENQPWHFESEQTFANAAVCVETTLAPEDLLVALQKIESEMGRTKHFTDRYEDRIIDLDILFYNQEIIQGKTLKIPHETIEERDFVLVPMCEIAPNFVHPQLHKTMAQLWRELQEKN